MAVSAKYLFSEPGAEVIERLARATVRRYRLLNQSQSQSESLATRWLEFQELLFTKDSILRTFQAEGRKLHLRVAPLRAPVRTIYSFVRGVEGVLRMMHHPLVAGAAGVDDTDSHTLVCAQQELDGVRCLSVTGELDLANVDTFKIHLSMASAGNGGIILDLRGLRYLDSTGINALMEAHRTLTPSGRRIVLVGLSSRVRRILNVLNLESLMPAFGSVEEALACLHSDGEGRPWTA